MAKRIDDAAQFRRYRNSRLYRSSARLLREYNRRLVAALHARGFEDFSPAFPQLLSNLDTEGSRIGVLARRAGITRQAAGQLVVEIERCGYVARKADGDDARATLVVHTPRGRKLLVAVVEILDDIDRELAAALGDAAFEQVLGAMAVLADVLDPHGVLGDGDRTA